MSDRVTNVGAPLVWGWLLVLVSSGSAVALDPCATKRPFTVRDWDEVIAAYERDYANTPARLDLARQHFQRLIDTARQCRERQRQREQESQLPAPQQPVPALQPRRQVPPASVAPARPPQPVLDAFERAKRALLAEVETLDPGPSPPSSPALQPIPLDTSSVRIPGTDLRESDYFYDLQMRRTGPRPLTEKDSPAPSPEEIRAWRAKEAKDWPEIRSRMESKYRRDWAERVREHVLDQRRRESLGLRIGEFLQRWNARFDAARAAARTPEEFRARYDALTQQIEHEYAQFVQRELTGLRR